MDVAGDQADIAVLNEIVEDAKLFSGFDIIVDDAGHKSEQMLSSLKVSISLPLIHRTAYDQGKGWEQSHHKCGFGRCCGKASNQEVRACGFNIGCCNPVELN